jgi:hypothetical protein
MPQRLDPAEVEDQHAHSLQLASHDAAVARDGEGDGPLALSLQGGPDLEPSVSDSSSVAADLGAVVNLQAKIAQRKDGAAGSSSRLCAVQ